MISFPRFGWNAAAWVRDGVKVEFSQLNPAIATTGRRSFPATIVPSMVEDEIDYLGKQFTPHEHVDGDIRRSDTRDHTPHTHRSVLANMRALLQRMCMTSLGG